MERGEADRADNRTRHGEGHRHRGPSPLRSVTELVRLRYFIDTLKAHELARQNRLVHPRGLAQWEGRRRRRDTWFVPEHRSDGRTVRLNPEERAAVDVERLADPPQRVAHRIIDAVGGQIDEARGQLGDQPLELELSFRHQRACPFGATPCGEIDDAGDDRRAGFSRERAQSYFDGKLRAVSAAAGQLAAGCHLLSVRHRHGAGAVCRVSHAELRQEDVDGLPDQLVARVPELPLDLMVGQRNHARWIHHQHTVGHRVGHDSRQPLGRRLQPHGVSVSERFANASD